MRGIYGLTRLVSLFLLGGFLLAQITRPASADEFNYKNMYPASVKLSSHYDFEPMVDDYMQAFRQNVWITAK